MDSEISQILSQMFANLSETQRKAEDTNNSVLQKILKSVEEKASSSIPRLLFRKEAADYLRVSTRQFDTIKIDIPVILIDRKPRYRVEDLEAYILQKRCEPVLLSI